jgi:hypothetical protein
MRHLAFLMVALPAAISSAQEVTGTVRAQSGGTPVAGAIVILGRPGASRGIATLTDDAGRFRLRGATSGTYMLRVDVVGYRSVTSPPFQLDSAATVTRDVDFTFERTQLRTVAVTATSSCERVADENGDAPRLWSEARKTLEASRLAVEEHRFNVALRRFERTIGLPDSVLRNSRTWTQTGVSQNPFESLSPDVIARDGYRARADSALVFYAPDARVLLSDEFVASHCFGTRRGGPDGAIGLTFRPQRLTSNVDISGVLWLDSATAELRTLEYRYVPSIGSTVGGGFVSFGRFPSGVWGVQRWAIRLPVLHVNVSTRRPDGAYGRFVDTVVVAVREVGGEVMTGAATAGAAGSDSRLRGTVFDSSTAAPLAGAVVTIEGLGRTTETDAQGRFAFDSLSDEGEFRVRVWHPRFDSLGMPSAVNRVRVRRRSEATLAVALPGVAEVAKSRCVRGLRDTQRIITGILRGPAGLVQPATEVVLLERRTTATGADSLVLHTEVSSDGGRYAFCQVRPGAPSWIVARADGVAWTDPRHIPPDGAPAVEVIPLRLPVTDSVGTDSTGSAGTPAIVLGRTSRAGSSRIAGWVLLPEPSEARVQVLVDGVARATVGMDGSFAVPDVAPGPRRLTFRGTGLLQRNLAVTAEAGQSQLLLVTLRPDPIVVVQVNAAPPDRLSGFRQRRRTGGGGVFIERADIERRNARQLSDLLRGVSGMRVQQGPEGLRYISVHFRRLSQRAGSPEADVCDMMMYVDGQPFLGNASAADARVRVSEVAGIEVYVSAASVPREFAGVNAACGVIVIWLRS